VSYPLRTGYTEWIGYSDILVSHWYLQEEWEIKPGRYELIHTGWGVRRLGLKWQVIVYDYVPIRVKIVKTFWLYKNAKAYAEVMWRFQQNGAFDPMGGSNGSA